MPNEMQSEAGMISMARIWLKLARGVGFSKGWAELALKNPPPLVPSILIASWEATGPTAMTCSTTLLPPLVIGLSQWATGLAPKVWTTPWETRNTA